MADPTSFGRSCIQEVKVSLGVVLEVKQAWTLPFNTSTFRRLYCFPITHVRVRRCRFPDFCLTRASVLRPGVILTAACCAAILQWQRRFGPESRGWYSRRGVNDRDGNPFIA